jgi:hypothetical protein
MDASFDNNRQYLEQELRKVGLEVTPEAWEPLRGIDFNKLVDILDHEEKFLRSEFLKNLQEANHARVTDDRGAQPINANDVRTALLLLGKAVRVANTTTIAAANKALIENICPYC